MRRLAAIVTVLLLATLAVATVTPGRPVTDATVIARLGGPLTRADELALAQYYRARAEGEAARIAFHDQLFRAYLAMEGKAAEPLQRQARELLKAARESRQHYELLAQAHLHRAQAE